MTTHGQSLLCALRKISGESPLTHRFKPSEWLAIVTELGLTESQKNEAIRVLQTSGFIEFTPKSTEILALTASGIRQGDDWLLCQQNRDLDGPIPRELEDIREDLRYWQPLLFKGEPGSNWWMQVQARLDMLKHAEGMLMRSVLITNNANGPNSRNNINSVDQSVNAS